MLLVRTLLGWQLGRQTGSAGRASRIYLFSFSHMILTAGKVLEKVKACKKKKKNTVYCGLNYIPFWQNMGLDFWQLISHLMIGRIYLYVFLHVNYMLLHLVESHYLIQNACIWRTWPQVFPIEQFHLILHLERSMWSCLESLYSFNLTLITIICIKFQFLLWSPVMFWISYPFLRFCCELSPLVWRESPQRPVYLRERHR